MRRLQIAVIGSGSCPPQTAAHARALGTALVDAGYRVVCGGLGGVMAAVAKGAQASESADGSDVIGVLPSTDHATANPHVDVVIATGMGIARNLVVVASADAVVAIEGGSGTLSEIALAWQLGRPVIAFAPTGGWAEELAGRSIDDRRDDRIEPAYTLDDVLRLLP